MDLLSSYYLCLSGHEIVSHSLPEGVTYQNQCLTFQNKEPIEFEMIYQSSDYKNLNISYRFEKNVQVNLIEVHQFSHDVELHQKIDILENANIHIFHQNDTIDQHTIKIYSEVHLKQDASCQCGYAELCDGHIDAHYIYHLDGENASALVRMAILSQNQVKKHYEVLIQHNQPHTYGQMDNYGVVKDQGHLTIDGIGTITKGQYGSASHQTNKIMVFDSQCVASANPYLYIDEYDVKASHAAGVGKMDEEHLYYLQSRGLTKKQAMQLITYGYLHPVVEVIDNETLKQQFEKALTKVGA